MQVSAKEVYPPDGRKPGYRLLDVRAPVELAKGELPWSINLPILGDHERHLVGVCYKESGQKAAIELGYKLTDSHMANRIAAWKGACAEQPSAIICWRGGLRSELVQNFVGVDFAPRVTGGYKASRKHLQDALPSAVARKRPLVVAGLTGSGKTDLLTDLDNLDGVITIDLEAIANHRGSAFGKRPSHQPSQATFENTLAAEVQLSPEPWLLLEDEGRRIGTCELPESIMHAIRSAPLLMLEVPIEERLRRLHSEYVVEPAKTLGTEVTRLRLLAALDKLKRRLGHVVVEEARSALADAENQGAWFNLNAHAKWIRGVLERYYDPSYEKALTKSARPVVARGGHEELRAWMNKNCTRTNL
jgi:tRNA 2-selenouridine synthase